LCEWFVAHIVVQKLSFRMQQSTKQQQASLGGFYIGKLTPLPPVCQLTLSPTTKEHKEDKRGGGWRKMRKPETIRRLYPDFDGFLASVEQRCDKRLRGDRFGRELNRLRLSRIASVISGASQARRSKGVKSAAVTPSV
jgi:hypothetical protein